MPTFHRVYGVGGPHEATTLITVSVLLMSRLLNQQVDVGWTSDICERVRNVGDVKVTDEDGFRFIVMVKDINTIMIEEFLTNRVAGQLCFGPASRPASEPRFLLAYCH